MDSSLGSSSRSPSTVDREKERKRGRARDAREQSKYVVQSWQGRWAATAGADRTRNGEGKIITSAFTRREEKRGGMAAQEGGISLRDRR